VKILKSEEVEHMVRASVDVKVVAQLCELPRLSESRPPSAQQKGLEKDIFEIC